MEKMYRLCRVGGLWARFELVLSEWRVPERPEGAQSIASQPRILLRTGRRRECHMLEDNLGVGCRLEQGNGIYFYKSNRALAHLKSHYICLLFAEPSMAYKQALSRWGITNETTRACTSSARLCSTVYISPL